MATLGAARPTLISGDQHRGKRLMPCAAAATVVGDLMVVSSGRVTPNNAPASNLTVGIAHFRGTPTAGDYRPVQIITPHQMWELSADDDMNSLSTNAAVGLTKDTADHATFGCQLDGDASTLANLVTVGFASDREFYETNPFIAEAGTSETAGATVKASSKGVPGDTNPRIDVFFQIDGLVWTKALD